MAAMASAAPTRRRWLQFGLGTMFLAVTVLAIPAAWVAYSLNWIRQRHEWAGWPTRRAEPVYLLVATEGSAPGLLWLFGERGFRTLNIRFQGDAAQGNLTPAHHEVIDQVNRLYSEAAVTVRELITEPD